MNPSLPFLLILLIFCTCVEQGEHNHENLPTVQPESPESVPESSELPGPHLPNSPEPEEPEPNFTFPVSPEDEKAYTTALKDIEKYRKGDVTLVITKEGIPVSNATVVYHQKEHSFLFGTISPYNPDVFELLKEAGINYVTFHFNWQATEPQENQIDTRGLYYTWGVEPLYTNGFTIKAHALTWMADGVTPAYMQHVSFELYKDKSYQHLYRIVSHFSPYIHIWNVINEPMAEWANIYDFSEKQVEEAIATGVKAIKNADPQGRIIINNASPAGEDYIVPPFDFLKNLNVDYDIIGLQFYYNGYTTEYEMPRHSLAYLASLVDTFSTLDKEVHITELSVPGAPLRGRKGYWGHPWSEELQAEYAHMAYTLFFSKKQVKAITWWDASDSQSFIYGGGLLDDNNNPKKIYYTLKDLIHSWTTHGEKTTDTDGKVTFRGFGGVYNLTITDETGLTYETTIDVKEQQSNNIFVVLDPGVIQHQIDQKANEFNSVVEDIYCLLDYWEAQGRDVTYYHKELGLLLQLELDEALEKAGNLRIDLAITRESIHDWETFENTNESIFDLSWANSGVLLTNGALYKSIPLKGRITLKILAKGDKGGGRFPTFFVMVGGSVSDVVEITSSQWQWYDVVLDITDAEEIAIIFTDDYYDPQKGEDRNVYINQVIVQEYLFCS